MVTICLTAMAIFDNIKTKKNKQEDDIKWKDKRSYDTSNKTGQPATVM